MKIPSMSTIPLISIKSFRIPNTEDTNRACLQQRVALYELYSTQYLVIFGNNINIVSP